MNTRLQHSKANGLIVCLTKKIYSNKLRIPTDITDLIMSYVDTKKCEDCGFIDSHSKWLKSNIIDSWIQTDSELYCPECNRKCENCKSVYVEEDTQMIDCEDFEFTKDICKCCLEHQTETYYYCENCEEYKCKCDECEGWRECDDCDTKYCFDCAGDGEIMMCEICGTDSCCKKFYRFKNPSNQYTHSEWVGECCLEETMHPHNSH